MVLSPFARERNVLGEILAFGRFLRVDVFGSLPAYSLVMRCSGIFTNAGIAQVAGAIAEGTPHRLGQKMDGLGRMSGGFFLRSKFSRTFSIWTRQMPPELGGGGP